MNKLLCRCRLGVRLIKSYSHEPVRVKLMMFEAIFYSAYYRYQITHKPFIEISPKIGTFQYETPFTRVEHQAVCHCNRAVTAACRYVPWDSKCLDQALAAKKILNKRGLPCTLYMGLIQDENHEMSAHAWLRCGTFYVTGGNGRGYAVTGIYGDSE